MMATLNKLVPALQTTSNQFPVEKMYQDMNKFEKTMDEIMVATNVVDGVMNKNNVDVNQDGAIDGMLNQIKQENYNQLQLDCNANNNQLFQELKNPA